MTAPAPSAWILNSAASLPTTAHVINQHHGLAIVCRGKIDAPAICGHCSLGDRVAAWYYECRLFQVFESHSLLLCLSCRLSFDGFLRRLHGIIKGSSKHRVTEELNDE